MKIKITPNKKICFQPIFFTLSFLFSLLDSLSKLFPLSNLDKSNTYRYSVCLAKDATTITFDRKLDQTSY
ncbi:hypothetical protein BC624_1142 [Flavobacterium granuli]|uniref:Uncharacterized protein n=1 Tax=Flavobacterium granuli TaxID=280093 RepID=A0A1M5TN96_9FLAO|nr:hypothetical protein BC624_1142 [Flavobacterium granuli]SHH51843.1 hypothetical protein SAMN05443373_1152 [Flavobacterium granuli]